MLPGGGPWRVELQERIDALEEELERVREERCNAVARAEDLQDQLDEVLHMLAEGWQTPESKKG